MQRESYTPHPFLARKSPDLLHFDLQLPVTSIRKTFMSRPTPLGLSDYREPASHPPCAEMVIEVEQSHGILIHAEPSRTEFVTVQDLRAIYGKLHQQLPPTYWGKAGKQSAVIISNFHKRHDRITELALGRHDDSTYCAIGWDLP